MTAARRALVLAGGGFAASAWQIGLVSGMASAGVDLRDSALFVGTSAGARVALHLANGADLDDLFQQQFRPPPGAVGSPANFDWPTVSTEWTRARQAGGDSATILRRVGALALAIAGTGIEERRKVVATQLPIHTWPERNVSLVAVNAETGERRAFDRASGVDLVDAVIATTAFFGWPPAFIDGQHYIDGGFYSSDNADLASGFEQVLVLALRAPAPSPCIASLPQAVEALRAARAQVTVIHPDEECMTAFASIGSVMNPAVRGPLAQAGRAQARRVTI